jgi:hypothetical protein
MAHGQIHAKNRCCNCAVLGVVIKTKQTIRKCTAESPSFPRAKRCSQAYTTGEYHWSCWQQPFFNTQCHHTVLFQHTAVLSQQCAALKPKNGPHSCHSVACCTARRQWHPLLAPKCSASSSTQQVCYAAPLGQWIHTDATLTVQLHVGVLHSTKECGQATTSLSCIKPKLLVTLALGGTALGVRLPSIQVRRQLRQLESQ